MRSTPLFLATRSRARWVVRLACVVLLVMAAAGCSRNEDKATTTTVAVPPTTTPPPSTTLPAQLVEIVVRRGAVQGGGTQQVPVNERVRLRVTSDTADEVHVHGYNHRFQVGPNGPAEITFIASQPGVFEVELEKTKKRLVSLDVKP